jgi:hypothetical protein
MKGFGDGALSIFTFQKVPPRGVVSPTPLSSSFHPSSFAMRWTVPVPMPSDLATFKIPTPFGSCFRTLRSVVLSILRPAELHALGWFPPEIVEANPSHFDKVRRMIRSTPVNGFIGCAAAIAVTPSFSPAMNRTGRVTVATAAAYRVP